MKPEAFARISEKIGEKIYIITSSGGRLKGIFKAVDYECETVHIGAFHHDMNDIVAYAFEEKEED